MRPKEGNPLLVGEEISNKLKEQLYTKSEPVGFAVMEKKELNPRFFDERSLFCVQDWRIEMR